MNQATPTHPSPTTPPARSRKQLLLVALLALAIVLLLSLRWVSRPSQVSGLLLDRVGAALGLEITASGASEYRLRGTPKIVLRDLVARQPGAAAPLLEAERVYLTLPWTTIRSFGGSARGADLTVTRIELDAPQLDLAALQAWRDSRPPTEPRIPTLTEGLHVVRGRIIGAGWSIEALDLGVPSLHPQRPVAARLDGHYLARNLRVPFDLDATLTRPSDDANLEALGSITIESANWRMPMRARLSGRLYSGDDSFGLDDFRYGANARYVTDASDLPFVFGLAGPLRYRAGFSIAPVGAVMRGESVMPTFDARGRVSLAGQLGLQLDGLLAQWPEAWPALPPPIGQSTSPLPFVLAYQGSTDLSGIADLRLRRDATRFEGRFRLPAAVEWLDSVATGTPLPPLDGTLTTPRLEISGGILEGVEIEFEETEAIPP